MTPVDFAQERAAAGQVTGDYLKLQEGPNRFRLLTVCLPHAGEYQGRKTFKWLCYVIDRRDGQVKPLFMASTIYRQIEALQQDPDYRFTAVPMPYDLTVSAANAGTKAAVYGVLPARLETPITAAELAQLAALKSLPDLQAALAEARAAKAAENDAAAPVPVPLPGVTVRQPATVLAPRFGALSAPPGFAEWWTTMQAIGLKGFAALEAAWSARTPGVFKAFVTTHHLGEWQALKAAALKVAR